jgi:hypothetical protein
MTINLDQYPQIYNKVDIDTGYLDDNNHFDYENKSLENVSNKIRNNVIITPPLYPTTLSSACIKNGYLYPMSLQDKPYPKCKTVDNFYYPSQQINKVLSDEDNEKDDKQNKKVINNDKDDNSNNNGSLDKVPSSRSYYELEPRFNNVNFPWRAYTWTYPIQPNTETYFRDNTRSLSPTPAYIPNLDLRKGTSDVKVPKLEKFNNISKNKKSKNIDPITIVIIIILILFLLKMCKII